MKNKGNVSSARVIGLSKKYFTPVGELSNDALSVVKAGLRPIVVA